MRASKKFVDLLHSRNMLFNVSKIKCELYGSLALTGVGHGTDYAVLMGLEGETPENVDPKIIPKRISEISKSQTINLRNEHQVPFVPIQDLIWYTNEQLPFHPNGYDVLSLYFILFVSYYNILYGNDKQRAIYRI